MNGIEIGGVKVGGVAADIITYLMGIIEMIKSFFLNIGKSDNI